jgi:hypothetical protein
MFSYQWDEKIGTPGRVAERALMQPPDHDNPLPPECNEKAGADDAVLPKRLNCPPACPSRRFTAGWMTTDAGIVSFSNQEPRYLMKYDVE